MSSASNARRRRIPRMRRKQQRFVSPDDPKKDAFTLLQVKGAAENPDELVLKLADTGETVSIAADKPYQRADAYAADLKYDPEKKNFSGEARGFAKFHSAVEITLSLQLMRTKWYCSTNQTRKKQLCDTRLDFEIFSVKYPDSRST